MQRGIAPSNTRQGVKEDQSARSRPYNIQNAAISNPPEILQSQAEWRPNLSQATAIPLT